MFAPPKTSPLGVLLSGGLDSSILLATLLRDGYVVQPFYIRTDVVWAPAEFAAVRRFLAAVETPALRQLLVFDLPLADLYLDHWSVSGVHVPSDATPDEAVYLPGRNALLAIKPLIWCQAHGIRELALATLAGNPFADATPEFLSVFSAAMSRGGGRAVEVIRPFAHLPKAAVLALARNLPIEHTFSCMSPSNQEHCGRCNKCGERRAAFLAAGLIDSTRYAVTNQSLNHSRTLV